MQTSQCVDLLTSAGADVNVRSQHGRSSIMAAVWKKRNPEDMQRKTGANPEKCVESLLISGADVNIADTKRHDCFIESR